MRGFFKGGIFTFNANFWQQFSTSQITIVSSYDEDTNILPTKGKTCNMWDQITCYSSWGWSWRVPVKTVPPPGQLYGRLKVKKHLDDTQLIYTAGYICWVITQSTNNFLSVTLNNKQQTTVLIVKSACFLTILTEVAGTYRTFMSFGKSNWPLGSATTKERTKKC